MLPCYDSKRDTKKSNAIIGASYRLSLNEQRVIYSVLLQLDDDKNPTDQKFYYVYANDIVPDGVGETNKFQALRDVCNSLYNRTITIEGIPNGATKTGIAPILETRWIQSKATYFEGEGRIGLRLTHDILPFISQLRRGFTRIPHEAMLAMTSSHAQRVFEMLMQFRDTGLFKITVADFRHRLDLENEYKRFTDLKKRVIEFAVSQINEKTDINVKVQYHKKGRSVKDLTFTFNKDTQEKRKQKKQAATLDLKGFSLEEVQAFNEKMGRDNDDPAALSLSARQLAKTKQR